MARSVRFTRFTLVLSSIIGLAIAQGGTVDPENRFVYPPQGGQSINENATVYSANINITYGVEQRQSFEWRTTYEDGVSVVLWQEGPPDMVQNVEIVECDTDESFQKFVYWDGDIGTIDLDNGTIAFLIAYQCNGTESSPNPFFYSHYFNLTAQVTTTSSTSESATPVPTASPTTAPVNNNNSSGNDNGGSTSNAAALGGGIGGGIGGALLIIALVLFFIYRRRQKKNANPQTSSGFTPVSQVQGDGYFPPISTGGDAGGAVAGSNSAYHDQNYGPVKYDPQHPPPRAELGAGGGPGGAYGYYDSRENKQQQQSPTSRAELD